MVYTSPEDGGQVNKGMSFVKFFKDKNLKNPVEKINQFKDYNIIKKILGVSSDYEYDLFKSAWVKRNYCLEVVNSCRKRLKLKVLKESVYHCLICGCQNDPFNYDNYRDLLIKNICLKCKGG